MSVGFASRFKFSPKYSALSGHNHLVIIQKELKSINTFCVKSTTSTPVFQSIITECDELENRRHLTYTFKNFNKDRFFRENIPIGFKISRNRNY